MDDTDEEVDEDVDDDMDDMETREDEEGDADIGVGEEGRNWRC